MRLPAMIVVSDDWGCFLESSADNSAVPRSETSQPRTEGLLGKRKPGHEPTKPFSSRSTSPPFTPSVAILMALKIA